MSETKSYFQVLAKPEEFKDAEKKLLYQIKMDESEMTPQKAREMMSTFETIWNIKASFNI
ncbi:hypothetical protein B1750_gp090 [Noumeavirus]|uniref:hypothetical protein n=1 Tax=Noumeavirus TaxID=1955558 RepID=UPI000982E5FE|nr:hypothetical protein B1750_gp090 [Noumeavirus]AQM73071.1 hypothetical protein NMV_090 [Noumeavirus]